jgi:uncharacterized protein
MMDAISSTTAPQSQDANGAAGETNQPVPPAPRMVTVEAADENKARAEAATQLGVPEKDLALRVLSRRKKGLFGLGGEVLTVEATWAAPPAPPPPMPSRPGRIEITCLRGRISLAVFRPEGGGRIADVQLLDELVKGWPLDARDEQVISSTLRSADGQARVFATMSPSVKVEDGAPAAVRVAKDDLTAWLIPWNPTLLDADSLRALLEGAKITAGVDQDLIATLDGQVLSTPTVIARGKSPKDGADARPEFVFQSLAGNRDAKPTVREDGSVDFRETGAGPLSVQPGDVLVRKIPLVPAEDGYTIKGKMLPAKQAKDLDLKRLGGQNTLLGDDGMEIVAKTSGRASRLGDRIVVMPVHTVDGDVDFKTGNVYFEGNLQIRGSVKQGFKVSATGNIQIGAAIEAALVEAGGDVTVTGGIVGQNEGVVRAGGAVTARFIEAAEVHAGGPVTVASEIRLSTVISEKSVAVTGAGRIVGGTVRGRDSVEAKIVGSSSNAPTIVQAGWGEELEVDVVDEVKIPKIVIHNEVNGGVLLTVAGASQRYSRSSTGGVWREKEGKLLYSAS